MAINGICANISCSDETASVAWYSRLFGRGPDERPMDKLSEWHFDGAALQLHVALEHAGHGTLTIIVSDIDTERERLLSVDIDAGSIEAADYTTIARMRDPDGNLVVLAQPG